MLPNKNLLENLVDPCEHYIKYGAKEQRNPNNFFDEQGYLNRNPDVAKDVEKGKWISGYEHFMHHGCHEGRTPDGIYDENKYVNYHNDLSVLKSNGDMDCAYMHCLQYGIAEGRDFCSELYS